MTAVLAGKGKAKATLCLVYLQEDYESSLIDP